MAAAFIPAKDLKRQYSVLGHFYSLHALDSERLECRSVLEITSKDSESNPTADAIFVMMNPGSSRPVQETGAELTVSSDGFAELSVQLVRTVPDTTQYQLMRVMHYSGWRHVRVLNLSDLRDPKSASFVRRYKLLERESGSTAHSLFSSQRLSELKRLLLREPGAPIICAWGVSDDLNPLIKRALAILASESEVTGLEKAGHPGKYFHPLPSIQSHRERWVNQILKLLHA